mmetsp:Transcript_22856/g.62727  ORF Transcript_22856/g.62727 Transcript_22856/m.62727 type:complete len:143 (-) Transcript_22856:510-938(-)|eukprot:scaffold77029_cov32-Tisochrysis_lutea.AAC.1
MYANFHLKQDGADKLHMMQVNLGLAPSQPEEVSPREVFSHQLDSSERVMNTLSEWYAMQAAAEDLELACPRPLVRINESYLSHPTSARSRAALDDPLFHYYEAQIKRSMSQSKMRQNMVECKVDEKVVDPYATSIFLDIIHV